jgi:hypothetical protein
MASTENSERDSFLCYISKCVILIYLLVETQGKIITKRKLIDPRKCGTVQIFSEESNGMLSHEETESRLDSSNVCYHSVQNILSSRLLFKSVKMKTNKNTALPMVLHLYQTWSLILAEAHILR